MINKIKQAIIKKGYVNQELILKEADKLLSQGWTNPESIVRQAVSTIAYKEITS